MELVYPPVIGFARLLFALQGLRFTVLGSENVPRTGGAVMAVNHIGYFDFAYAGLAARPSKRLVRFMAKESVFRHRVSGPLMRGMKHIPVDRASGGAAYRAALTALRAGEIVGVFPEATISVSFELKDFKVGAVRMAMAAGVPLLPTVVWGSQRVWTKGKPKRLGRTNTPITIAVGEPLHPTRKDNANEVTAELWRRMRALLDDTQQSYPEQPAGAWWLPARLGGGAPPPEIAGEAEDTGQDNE